MQPIGVFSKRGLIPRVLSAFLFCAVILSDGCSSSRKQSANSESSGKTEASQEAAQSSTEDQKAPPVSQAGQAVQVFLGKPTRSGTTLSFPVHFHAAAGQKIGLVHLEMDIPDAHWKFLTFDAPLNSRLDISTESLEDEGENAASRKVEISNGSRVIPNGPIGTLEFSLPGADNGTDKSPTMRILDTWPPEKSAASNDSKGGAAPDSAAPVINDPAAKAPENPAMSCFFFSH